MSLVIKTPGGNGIGKVWNFTLLFVFVVIAARLFLSQSFFRHLFWNSSLGLTLVGIAAIGFVIWYGFRVFLDYNKSKVLQLFTRLAAEQETDYETSASLVSKVADYQLELIGQLDERGNIVFINAPLSVVLGCSGKKCVGEKFSDTLERAGFETPSFEQILSKVAANGLQKKLTENR